eukprot:CAMPEP_0114991326 /NCGR_PEP_ID=MMETSP0216-20121206/11301_1 /TAXON_ID=223996 /ORGANISM="Protocruzia adherens, Strain Boccale" /LENGTH=717 /DNA_ID=CAMNT_0002354623 /DNA_START=91 /DNA_END=2244 /DNA_ORIENTATION=+
MSSAIKEASIAFATNPTKAVEILGSAIDSAGTEERKGLYSTRGQFFMLWGRPKDALKDFVKALECDQSDADLQNQLGCCYVEVGQNERGIELLTKSLKGIDEKEKHLVLYNRARGFLASGNFDRAIEDITIALEQKSDDGDVWLIHGRTLIKQFKHQEAIKSLEKSLELNPNLADGYYYLGMAHRALGDGSRALEIADQGIQRVTIERNSPREDRKSYAKLILFKAKGQMKIKDYEGALQSVNKAIKTREFLFDAYSIRGNIHRALSNYKQAADDYSIALNYDPYSIDNIKGRASSFNACHKFADALEDYQQVLSLEPSNEKARVRVNELKENLSQAGDSSDIQSLTRSSSSGTSTWKWMNKKDFKIVESIGHGGQAETFKASRIDSDQIVAIKMFSCRNAEEINKRKEEMNRIIDAMQDPICVNCYGFFLADHNCKFELGIVLEYIEGMTINQYARKKECLPIPFLEDLSIELIKFFAGLQTRGIVHHDITPNNIMITKDRKVKIIDFGLSYKDIIATIEASVAGTLAYLAPEVLEAHQKGRRRLHHNLFKSDVFALGTTLIEMCIKKTMLYLNSDPAVIKNCRRHMKDNGHTPEFIDMLSQMAALDPSARPDFLDLIADYVPACRQNASFQRDGPFEEVKGKGYIDTVTDDFSTDNSSFKSVNNNGSGIGSLSSHTATTITETDSIGGRTLDSNATKTQGHFDVNLSGSDFSEER